MKRLGILVSTAKRASQMKNTAKITQIIVLLPYQLNVASVKSHLKMMQCYHHYARGTRQRVSSLVNN